MNPIDDEFLDKCKEITSRYEKMWGRWKIDSQILHVITELCEVKDVLRNKDEKYGKTFSYEYNSKLHDEIADVFLTAIAMTNILKIPNDQLNQALNEKLQAVKERLEKREQDGRKFAKELIDKFIPCETNILEPSEFDPQ